MTLLPRLSLRWPGTPPNSYAQELGWTAARNGSATTHSGYYRAAPGVRFRGYAVSERGRRKLTFYIFRPPLALLQDTEYGGCFHFAGDDWWLVAFRPGETPLDLASGVGSIQKALRRAFALRAAKRQGENRW